MVSGVRNAFKVRKVLKRFLTLFSAWGFLLLVFVACFIAKASDATQESDEAYAILLPRFRVVLSTWQLGLLCSLSVRWFLPFCYQ